MATMQDLIEQWKKEAVQSQTVTGPEIPNIAMYQAQNDVHRDYGAANSALAREVANQQMLSQPVVQMAPTGLDVTMQEKQDFVKARREAEALQAAQSIPSGTGIGSSLQMLPSMADYQSNAVSNRDGVLKYIADHPDEAEYVTRFLELNNGEMDGIKYKNYLKQQKDYELAQKWVDPNYKMSKEEEKYGEKLALDRYKVLSSKKNRTPEEDAELRTMDDLFMKTDEFSSFILNSADEAVKAVRGVKWLTDHGFMGPVQMLANKITDPISNKILGAYDEVDKTPIQNAQVQNPIASGAGRFATNAALYAATNPAFDAIAEASGLTGAGKFALNQAAQFGQDVALDTIPTYVDMTKDGSLSDEERKELAKGALYNAGGNLVMGGLSELFKGANPAGIPEVDKVVKEATEQAETAQKRVQELARQNEEVLPALGDMTKGAEDIPYTVTKAEPEIPKMEIPKVETQKTASKAEIEELNNELSNMWGDNAAKETKSAAKTQRLDLPEEVTEKGASDFDEIYTAVESMRKKAEATGNPKVIEKYEKLSKAVNDYEEAFFKVESEEELVKAKKAADAARQSFVREMKKVDPNYTGELTGTKLGNAAYRRTSMKANEKATQELVDSIIETEKDLGENNRWVRDAVSETQNPFKGVEPEKIMAEDIGLNPKTDLDYTLKEIPESEAPKAGDSFKDTTEVKERGQSRHIRNADTPMKMEDVSDEVVADFEKDPDMYAVLKNKDTKAKAENIYNTSANPEVDFREMLSRKDPAALPLGHQLAKDYSAAGNHSAAAQIYRDMGEALTQSGQFSQAAVINMVKNDPLTALDYAQKELNKLNDIGKQRFGAKWTDFELTPDEINAFRKIQPGDADGIKDVYDLIGSRLGKEYPTTFWDKVIEARRVAMLFNPRTNVRNFLANPPTLAMRWASDRVEALGQNLAHIIDPNIKVTQSIYGSGTKGRKLAKEIYNGDQVQALLKGSGSKSELPELKNAVMTKKQVFKGTPVSKFIDKMTSGGIQKANEKLFGVKGVQSLSETLRNATYKALDLGDKPFVKENFVERLGSYIAAQGYKSASEVPEEAIMTAWEEAMKATYKDNSWAVGMLKQIKGGIEKADNVIPGLGTAVSQSSIPFVQAPGNIAARMVDYSPVGAVKGLANIVSGAKNGSVKSIEKGIEETAKGLTGTGLIVLGMKLREAGVLTGTYSENKRQRAFQKQNGFKEFAIHAGDGYFTYGWAQPFAEELMVGTLLQDAIEKSDEYDSEILKYFGVEGSDAGKAIGVAKAGSKAAVNSWFNESPISGLADFFKGNTYSDTDIAGNIWGNGVEDFAGALVPAAVNATAKSLDPVQRNTLDSTNKFASFVNSNAAKLPVLSESLPAKYDTWGNEMRYAKTKTGAAATKFLLPGDYGYDKNDNTDNEINRLFEETGNNNVFPPEAEKTIGDQKLDNWGVSTYQEDMGKRNRQLAESFIKSDLYKNLPDEERAEILGNLYGASKTITKRDKFDSAVPDSSSYKKAIAAYDEAGGGQKGVDAMINFYAGKKIISDTGISDSSNAAKEIQEAALSGDMKKAEKLADNAAKTKEILDKYDISTSSNAGKDIKAAIEAGKPREAEMIAKKAKAEKEEQTKAEETKDTLSSYGLDKTGPTKTYEKAKSEIPSLTTQQFATTYKKIDSDGNQGIKQQELLDYLNKYVTSESKAQEIWSAYGGWKNKKGEYKKLIKNKDGSWGSSY